MPLDNLHTEQTELNKVSTDWLLRLLAGLYGKPTDKIIAARPQDFDPEPLILLLWTQQWPRLRRVFRFCTLAAADRSGEVGAFDLQLLPVKDRAARGRFSEAVEAERVRLEPVEWLDYALDDIISPKPDGLRDFLRKVGGDVPSGRESFRPLCRLYGLLNDLTHTPAGLENAIDLLEGPLASIQAKSARSLIVDKALEYPNLLKGNVLAFLVRHLGLLELNSRPDRADIVGPALWGEDPGAILLMLREKDDAHVLAERALHALSASDLISGLRLANTPPTDALQYRPDLVEDTSLWSLEGLSTESALDAVDAPTVRRSVALAAMVESTRTGLADEAVRRFGSAELLPIITDRIDQLGAETASGELLRWLRKASADGSALAKDLGSDRARARTTLVAIARATAPDLVPNEYGEDPWITAIQQAKGLASQQGGTYLASYLLSRALGYRSRSQAELAMAAFDTVYDAAARSHISDEAWRLLDSRLPTSYFWFEWDRCKRLRAAITGLFVDRNLAPFMFGCVTASDNLFLNLLEIAGRDSRGRQYLRRVAQALRDTDQAKFSARIQALDEITN
ncbi:MAG: hypothetical protein BroJett024_08890 [Alphaproteobacteria bacterium]|nr:MAG: hypothetical protein BroJett024_08890 [Alphaproteobacteria bacterium]